MWKLRIFSKKDAHYVIFSLIILLVVSIYSRILSLMKHVLILLVMVSLTFAPATATEPCSAEMEMSVSGQSDEIILAAPDMDCCHMPGEMPDDCAVQCATACISILTVIYTPFGAYEFEAASLLHGASASSAWLTHSVTFEPPPPRI